MNLPNDSCWILSLAQAILCSLLQSKGKGSSCTELSKYYQLGNQNKDDSIQFLSWLADVLPYFYLIFSFTKELLLARQRLRNTALTKSPFLPHPGNFLAFPLIYEYKGQLKGVKDRHMHGPSHRKHFLFKAFYLVPQMLI